MNDDVISFISFFKAYDQGKILENTFLYGYCYYFAIILQERFGGIILYDSLEGHFLTYIGDKLYDIRGEVTSSYKIESLLTKRDWMKRGSIIRGVILKSD